MKRIFLIILSALLTATPVFAANSESVLDFMAKNGIYYYDPSGSTANCAAGLGSYDGITTAGLSPLQSAFIDTYHDIAAQLSQEYGIPWETVMAQGILESASGTSRFARERNNFFGIGAFDSNPNNAHSFSSPVDGWRGYYENIRNTATYRNHGAFNYANDPYGYLQAIKSAGYATDPNYVQKVGSIIKAIENRAEEKGWQLSSSLESSTASISLSNLTGCAAQGNGDLNSTALTLSWPDRSHAIDDPKAEYREALAAVGLNSYGERYVQIGASCDAFVATVLRFSGVDENVPCCGAANMLAYFVSHPDLYEEIPNLGNSSNLQPGDIRSKPSHIEMYVELEDGTGRIASASHADRTADHAISYYPDSAYRIFRRRS